MSKEAGSSVEGKYALWLYAADSIVQQGDIPADARFLSLIPGALPVAVSVNGVRLPGLPPIITSSTLTYDISAYAGQNVELRFQPIPNVMVDRQLTQMDSITFLVPEPSIYALFVAGGGVFLLSWIRRRLKR
jgi:hypothetical protein